MKNYEFIPIAFALGSIIYAFPHIFHLPVVRIPFFDTDVAATSITSLSLFFISAYLLLSKQPFMWRCIATITLVEVAFIGYEAVHSSFYFFHHMGVYPPDWAIKMIIFSAILFGVLYLLQKHRNLFLFDGLSLISFCLFFTSSLFQIADKWYVSPIDDLSCVIHQTIGFWMWLSIIKVKP